MQLMPKTAKYIANKYDIEYKNLYDIESNIQIGTAYLYHLKKKFGSYELAAAGYNGGNVGARKYRDYLIGKIKGTEVHQQTFKYVPKVMNYVYDYRKLTKM
jgi:soluble lytic murein transglycosylase